MKEKRGQIFEKKNGLWVARVAYKNKNGKKTAVQKTVESKSEANRILKNLLDKLERGGREEIDAEKLTFNDLVDYYEKHYAKPAKFIDDRKVEGLRNFTRIKGFIKQFRAGLVLILLLSKGKKSLTLIERRGKMLIMINIQTFFLLKLKMRKNFIRQ